GVAFVGYAVFYFVRKNIPLALPVLEQELGVRKAQLGLALTLHDLVYGVSKLYNGVLGDRTRPGAFMAAGLLLCAICNVGFGLSSTLVALGACWVLNGWFQG